MVVEAKYERDTVCFSELIFVGVLWKSLFPPFGPLLTRENLGLTKDQTRLLRASVCLEKNGCHENQPHTLNNIVQLVRLITQIGHNTTG